MSQASLKSLSINGKLYIVKEFSYKLPTIKQDFVKGLNQVSDITSYEPNTGEMDITYLKPDNEISSKYNMVTDMTVVATLNNGVLITLKSGIVIDAPQADIQGSSVKISIHSNSITEEIQ
jgi:hypothetical protein